MPVDFQDSCYWVLLVWGCFSVSKTIIPEAQEHLLTASTRRNTHIFGGLGLSPVITPFSKVPPNGSPSRQAMRHQPPRYAAPQHVQNAVDLFPQVHGSGMASHTVRWQQGREHIRFDIGQIAGIRFSTRSPSATIIFPTPQEPNGAYLANCHGFSNITTTVDEPGP